MKKMLLVLGLLFSANLASAQGVIMDQEIKPGTEGSDPMALTVWNNNLYFFAADSATKSQLWRYDGTSKPQEIDIPEVTSVGSGMVVYNNKLYFSGSKPGTGFELFVYDGTNPPALVEDIRPGSSGSAPRDFVVCGGKLFFTGFRTNSIRALYSYDGINPVVTHGQSTIVGSASALTNFNGQLYFSASNLYTLDPSTDSLRKIDLFHLNPSVGNLVVEGNKLYFMARNSQNSVSIYHYSGSGIPIQLTGPSTPGFLYTSGRDPMYAFQNALYFVAVDDLHHDALIKYDIASGNASALSDLYNMDPAGAPFVGFLDGQVYNSALYLSTMADSSEGFELYKTDGNLVTLVADIAMNPGEHGLPADLCEFNGRLYMSGHNGLNGRELFRLNNTTGMQSVRFPGEVKLHPNPATTSATLSIILQSAQRLRVSLTDIAGREVFATGVQDLAAGKHEVTLPLEGLASGQYVYRICSQAGAIIAGGSVVKQ